MSRIFISGLPRHCSEDSLRKHFSEYASDITDCKIARTKEGNSRQFGFIGFRSESIGPLAASKYNRSFMGSVKLSVEVAKDVGEKVEPAWKKNKEQALTDAELSAIEPAAQDGKMKSRHSKKETLRDVASADVKNKEKLEEYLALSKSRTNMPTWVNDDAMSRQKMAGQNSKEWRDSFNPDGTKKVIDDDEDDENAKGERAKLLENESDDEYDEFVPKESVSGKDAAESVESESESDAEEKKKPISDLDYLKSKMKSSTFNEDDDDWGSNDDDEDDDDDDDVKSEEKMSVDEESESDGESEKVKSSKRVAFSGTTESLKERSDEPDEEKADKKVDEKEVDVAETGRLFVRNLPYDCDETSLQTYFSRFGRVADLQLPRDAQLRPKGFAFVTFMFPEDAVRALAGADGKTFQGRLLHVLGARPPPEPAAAEEGDAASRPQSFKERREAERRRLAGSDFEADKVWNSLFVRADTAIAAAAQRTGQSALDVVGLDAGNAAVRVALAETHVVQETKEFLASEGIDLNLFARGLHQSEQEKARAKDKKKDRDNTTSVSSGLAARSDTSIVIKNLPASADATTLRELFGRHGPLVKFVMPPSRAVAIVEYADPKAAKRAMVNLAYARYQRVPLYLEWALEGTIRADAVRDEPVAVEPVDAGKKRKLEVTEDLPESKEEERKRPKTAHDEILEAAEARKDQKEKAKKGNIEEKAVEEKKEEKKEEKSQEGCSVFVKNLAFATTEDVFKKFMQSAGRIRSARIPTRPNLKFREGLPVSMSNPEKLSLGFGFVEYETPEAAQKAIRVLQGKMLDGHSLQLKISHSAGIEAPGPRMKERSNAPVDSTVQKESEHLAATSTKLMVRNLAFGATQKDVEQLFSSFGSIKTVRLPKKFDGSHRGFAFVDFLTHAEAEAAKKALASTHLYGRHLVIEWASSESN